MHLVPSKVVAIPPTSGIGEPQSVRATTCLPKMILREGTSVASYQWLCSTTDGVCSRIFVASSFSMGS